MEARPLPMHVNRAVEIGKAVKASKCNRKKQQFGVTLHSLYELFKIYYTGCRRGDHAKYFITI